MMAFRLSFLCLFLASSSLAGIISAAAAPGPAAAAASASAAATTSPARGSSALTTDICAQFVDCNSCGTYSFENCGWCSTSDNGGFCASGTSQGPTNRTCLSQDWFVNNVCPDTNCVNFFDCNSCNSLSDCGWCESSNLCMPVNTQDNLPTSGYTCAGAFDTNAGQCPLPDLPDDTLPSSGIWAIVILVLAGFFTVIRFTIYVNPRMCVPVLGSRLIGGAAVAHDYSTTVWRGIVFLVANSAIALKIFALAMDKWDFYSESDPLNQYVKLDFGVLKVRQTSSVGDTSETYADMCNEVQNYIDQGVPDLVSFLTMCLTGRAAGILTLAYGIISVLFSVILGIFALVSVVNASRVASNAVKMWRLAGISSTFSLACYTVWLSAHMVFHHIFGSLDASVLIGASWYCMLGAFALDCFLLFLFRRIAVLSPNPDALVTMPYQQLNPGYMATSYNHQQPFVAPPGSAAPTQQQYNPPYNPHAQPYQNQQMYQPARGNQSGF